jgi:hypothetical protein
MILPNQKLLVLENHSLDFAQVATRNSTVSCKHNRLKPKLALAVGCADVNVSGFG